MTDVSSTDAPRNADFDGDFEIDGAGCICNVDRNACGLLGYATHELVGLPLTAILAEDQEPRLSDDTRRMANGKVLRTEWRMRRKDGGEFVAEVIGRGLGGLSMRFIARDATERKANQIAKARLAAIVESSNDAIVSMTLSGIVTTWNGAAERMFGHAASEMIGQSIRQIIPSDRQAEEDDLLARIARGKGLQNFETVRLHRDGNHVIVALTVSPIFNDAGEIVGVSKILRDITENQLAKAQLRESEGRFRTLADNISQFAWMADASGWIFWYNQRWYDYTGTTLKQMQGWGWKAVHHPDHVDRVVTRIQHSWDTGELWEDTFPLRGADGKYRWFLSRAQPIRDENGQILRWFGTNTDITEQIQREEQIHMLLREVNHRSKNMLALVQAIARQTAATDIDEFMERFQQRIQALSASQDLLVNSGWQGADVADLVRSQLVLFQDLIGSRILVNGPPFTLVASAAQALGMALHELATNAGKYGALSNDTGLVRIHWGEESGADGSKQFYMEWVESGGPAVLPPSRRGFGSIVIEKMAGVSMSATAELEFDPKGVVWRLSGNKEAVVGPAREREPAKASKSPKVAVAGQILVVDDDTVLAWDMIQRLESAGFQTVGPARDVEEAFALLDNHSCNCALLDIHLDAGTSEPIAQRLIERDIPFLAISGYARDQQPEIFRKVPSLTKPVDTAALIAFIKKHCPHQVQNGDGDPLDT